MNIVIISGSPRKESQTQKVCKFIQEKLTEINTKSQILELSSISLPFYDDTIDENTELQNIWNEYSNMLSSADGFVIATPEWNGIASPMLKNFFMFLDHEFRHKPAMIVSVSSGVNGAYPVAELRSSSYKNCGIVYIPNHIIIRNSESLFKKDETPETAEVKLHDRIIYSLTVLTQYAQVLKKMRTETKLDYTKFQYGM